MSFSIHFSSLHCRPASFDRLIHHLNSEGFDSEEFDSEDIWQDIHFPHLDFVEINNHSLPPFFSQARLHLYQLPMAFPSY
jgi:hypothetical protein